MSSKGVVENILIGPPSVRIAICEQRNSQPYIFTFKRSSTRNNATIHQNIISANKPKVRKCLNTEDEGFHFKKTP